MSERLPYPDLFVGTDETLCEISRRFSRVTGYIPLKQIDFRLSVVTHVREYRQRTFTACFLHHEHVNCLGLLYLLNAIGRFIWLDPALSEATLNSRNIPAAFGAILPIFPLLVNQDSLEVGSERIVFLDGGCRIRGVNAIEPFLDEVGELLTVLRNCDIALGEWVVVAWFLRDLEKPHYRLRPYRIKVLPVAGLV